MEPKYSGCHLANKDASHFSHKTNSSSTRNHFSFSSTLILICISVYNTIGVDPTRLTDNPMFGFSKVSECSTVFKHSQVIAKTGQCLVQDKFSLSMISQVHDTFLESSSRTVVKAQLTKFMRRIISFFPFPDGVFTEH